MQLRLMGALVLGALIFFPAARAQSTSSDDAVYQAPSGQAPPVAPPLRKGSPLDHLANDPKQNEPTIGYVEGNTRGATFWIAHRHIDEQGGQGWGWIRKNSDGWGSATWIALQETLGLAVAPHRKLYKADEDEDWEYRFWGHFAPYKAYDPRLDEQLPVFVLQGYQVLGQAAPLNIKVGAPDRIEHRPSGASSRESRPILSDPGVD